MTPYWIMFLLPFFGGVLSNGQRFGPTAIKFVWFLVWAVFTLCVGFRYEVGGDWLTYVYHLNTKGSAELSAILSSEDPGYYFINYIVDRFGGGIVWVNTLCGMIFMYGVVRFAKYQPLPWLAFLVSVPYLIIVVGMGYTRQATALGFVLVALVSLSEKRLIGFVACVCIGAAFHKSAVLILPIAALASSRRKVWNFFWVGVVSLLAAYFFVLDSAEELWEVYVQDEYESSGGLIRVLMNAVPALLFITYKDRISFSDSERNLWFWISMFSLACIPLVLVSSTATDRVALYFIPLQVFVFSRIHLLTGDRVGRGCIVLGVVFYYAAVQTVWLLYADNVQHWLPYQMYPFAS